MREIFETLARAVELNRKNNKGFTLVELLIVIAIIAILAAIAIPQFTKYKQRAYVAAMKNDAHNIISSEENYFATKDKYCTGSCAEFSFNNTQGTLKFDDGQTIKLSKNVVMLSVDNSTPSQMKVDPKNIASSSKNDAIVGLTCEDGSPGYGFALGHENIKDANGYYTINVYYNSCVDNSPEEKDSVNGTYYVPSSSS